MTQTYAAKVKAIRAQMVTQIQARGTADSILAAGTVFAGDKIQDRTFQKSAIYVLKETGQPPEWDLGQRRVHLHVPVVCVLRSLTDASATDALTDLEGVVVDAIGADVTLAGLCTVALPEDVTPGVMTDKDTNVSYYMSTVMVDVLMFHTLG